MTKKRNISNKKTSAERQEIERLLETKDLERSLKELSKRQQDDPFMQEAAEGLSEFDSANQIKKVLAEVDENILHKTGYSIDTKRGFTFNSPAFMVAASALVLMVAAFFIFRPGLPEKTIVSEVQKKPQLESSEIISTPDRKTDEENSDLLSKMENQDAEQVPEAEINEESSLEEEAEVVEEATTELLMSDEITDFDEDLNGEITDPIEKDGTDDSSAPIVGNSNSTSETQAASGTANEKKEGYLSTPADGIRNVREESIKKVTATDIAQTESVVATKSRSSRSGTSYGVTTQQAGFVGGESALKTYLTKNTRFPKKYEGNTDLTVPVTFIVDEKGKIKEVSVVRAIHPELDKEAIRVVKNMPKWNPAISNGVAFATRHSVNVVFKK